MAAWGYLVSALRRPLLNAVPLVSNIERRSDPESDRLRIERRGAAAAATFPRDGPGALTNSRRGRFFVQIDPEPGTGPEIV